MTRLCSESRTRGHTISPCKVRASWKVGVLLHAHEYDPGVEYYFETALICNACRARLKLDDILSDKLFLYITKALIAAGKQVPMKRYTQLCFEKLTADVAVRGAEWARQ